MQSRFFHYVYGVILATALVAGFGLCAQAQSPEDGQVMAEKIAGFARKAIYNLDTDQLRAVVETYLAEHEEIKALNITENVDQERLLNFFRKGNEAIYNQPIPNEILELKSYTAASIFEGKKIGTVTINIASSGGIELSEEERAWIKNNPVIRVHNETNWPPFNFAENGEAKGYSIDFMNMVAERVGLTIKYISGPSWNEFLDMMKSGDLDVMLNIVKTPERQKYLLFTPPYGNNPNTILSRKNSPYNDLEELFGKTVSVPKGFFYEEILKNEYPQINILALKNTVATMNAVNLGNADAALGELAVFSHLMATNMMTDLKISGVVNVGNPELALLNMATRKDSPLLASILTKGIQAVEIADKRSIQQKWVDISLEKTSPSEIIDDETSSKYSLFFYGAFLVFIVVSLLVFIWFIKNQRRPFLQTLRGKSILFILGVFVLVGSSMVWAMSIVGDQISIQLGSFMAERYVLWHKEKVIGAVQRELALAKQMANSELLIRWSQDENNPSYAEDARNELQQYHDNFKARTFFIGLKKSGHFFYSDEKTNKIELTVKDTLSPADDDDAWFFSTVSDKAPYNLNVDHNIQLGVTNLWVNYALRSNGHTYGVVGTGIHLTDFIRDHIESDTRGITALMIDDRGVFRAHSDKAKIAHNVVATGETQPTTGSDIWALLSTDEERQLLQDHMTKRKEGDKGATTFFLNIEGVRSLVAISYLEPLGWYTLAIFEPDKMIGLKETGTLVAILSISLLITVFVFLVGQNVLIISPLRELMLGANKVASGDYDVQLPITQLDEIGDLTQTFNGMASTISDYTRNLEGKVAERTQELTTAHKELSTAMGHIEGSIDYASRIQRSVLPDDTLFQSLLSDYFVLWEPRDVVGGDIYWCRMWGDGLLMILGDCTGHGVPGAFMTLIATGALDNALSEVPKGQVGQLLQQMHQFVQITLGQHGGGSESDDGLELGMCYLGSDMDELTFTGARFELYQVEDGGINVIKGTKCGIGYRGINHAQEFEEHRISNLTGKSFYMISDGLIDQVGGEKKRMFGKRRFRELLLSLQDIPMSEQNDAIYQALVEYQGEETRRDDVSVIGFKV